MRERRPITLDLCVLALLAGGPAQAQWVGLASAPSDTPVNEAISPAVVVQVDDAPSGNEAWVGVSLRLCQGGATLGGQTSATADASGRAIFADLTVDQPGTFTLCGSAGGSYKDGGGNEYVWMTYFSTEQTFRVFVTGASTTRKGPQAQHIYALKIPPGSCHPAFPCPPGYQDSGDTLPVGDPFIFIFGAVFDTGSSVVLVNNVTTPYGSSDANSLNLCNAAGDCGVPSTPPYHDPKLPLDLTVRLWPLSSYQGGGVPGDGSTNVPAIQVRPGTQALLPTLIGAPVAAQVIASIDYPTTVTKASPFGTWTAPDIRFYLPGAADIPVPPFEARLERRGDFGRADTTDNASVGPRFMVKNVAIARGDHRVTDADVGILYDTGSTTTVVTEEVARLLGIDPANDPPVDVYTLNTVRGEAVVRGYLVDRFSITTRDGLHEYRIDSPMIYVQPDLTDPVRPPFPDGIDVVLGSNYFAWTRVLFDGPGDTLGLWEAVSLDPDGDGRADAWDNCPSIYNPDQRDNDLDDLGNACDPDDDNDDVADQADNCPLHFNPDQVNSDSDTLGNACDPDDDNDDVADAVDNCPLVPNVDQRDTDGDALGNACDPDDDGDGVPDATDNCPLVYNADQANLDGDGAGNACDPDDDNDMAADWLDNCPLRFNPDQVDSDGDGLGDPCDPGQTATVILPASTTSLSTPDGAVSVVIPPMAVLAPHTLTLLPGADGFQVVGSMGSGATATMEVLLSYDVRVGGSDTFALQPGKTATLTLTIPATAPANQAFATRTLAIASKEDTDGVPGEDTFVLIPDCASGETTADGRCTVVEALDANGDLVTEAYRLSAPVTHFSTYGAVAIEVCTATAVFDPRTLNRNSAGNWVTVYLEFPGCRFGPDDVAAPTVRLRALTPARSAWIPVAAGAPFTVGDKDRDGAPDLMVKFDRPTVASWCAAPGEATFGLRGNFAGGTLVEATMAPVCIP